MKKYDLFIFAAENSADLLGNNLISELKKIKPNLKILSVAGPLMRNQDIDVLLDMENFKVMGFTGIIFSLFRIIKLFFYVRKKILKENPKLLIFIDYPDFNLRLEKSLRKKGFNNKIIHYVAPTVWAWRKNRTDFMAKYIDVLITIFPFEKKYFSHTPLKVEYIGHPLLDKIKEIKEETKDLIGIFPGSRTNEIKNNLPIQLKASKRLLLDDPNLKFAISSTDEKLIKSISKDFNLEEKNFLFFPSNKNYEFMPKLKFAIATSGTINLELAIHKVPTIVNYYINPIDVFIATKILKINLKFYSIVNILLDEEIFYELYGPNLSIENLYLLSKKVLFSEKERDNCSSKCLEIIQKLHSIDVNKKAARIIFSNL